MPSTTKILFRGTIFSLTKKETSSTCLSHGSVSADKRSLHISPSVPEDGYSKLSENI